MSKIKLAIYLVSILLGCTPLKNTIHNNSSDETFYTTGNDDRKVLVIGHRGASGYRPEHTLASYELAIDMGADFIETDLVSSKDGVLIARHENEISETTNVKEKFWLRKATKCVDGESKEGWFTEDFTLKELKTLKAKERLGRRNHFYDGKFDIPTFSEILDLVRRKEKETGRTIGVYPETKHPTYFDQLGLPLEERLVDELKKHGYNKREDAVFIQSFEPRSLRKIRDIAPFKLIQLIDNHNTQPYDFVTEGDTRTFKDLVSSYEGLNEIKTYADGIGPNKSYITEDLQKDSGYSATRSKFVDLAHSAGLLVHAWTFRIDELPERYQGNPIKEYLEYQRLKVDGFFSDFPDVAVCARDGICVREALQGQGNRIKQ